MWQIIISILLFYLLYILFIQIWLYISENNTSNTYYELINDYKSQYKSIKIKSIFKHIEKLQNMNYIYSKLRNDKKYFESYKNQIIRDWIKYIDNEKRSITLAAIDYFEEDQQKIYIENSIIEAKFKELYKLINVS